MIFSRVPSRTANRVYQPLSKSTRRPTFRNSRQSVKRRGYATAGEEEGHTAHKASSDWPWAITSLIITVPSVYILGQPQLKHFRKKSDSHHGEGHGGHGEHEEKDEHGEDSKSSHEEELKSDDHETGEVSAGEDGSNDAENTGSEESGESGGVKTLGEASEEDQDPTDKDLGASSKPAGNPGDPTTQSAKEAGLSNADTKHSTDPTESGHATKQDGSPETSKSKGTVELGLKPKE